MMECIHLFLLSLSNDICMGSCFLNVATTDESAVALVDTQFIMADCACREHDGSNDNMCCRNKFEKRSECVFVVHLPSAPSTVAVCRSLGRAISNFWCIAEEFARLSCIVFLCIPCLALSFVALGLFIHIPRMAWAHAGGFVHKRSNTSASGTAWWRQ